MADNWPGQDGSLRDLVKGGLANVREAIAHLCIVISEMDKPGAAPEVKMLELEVLGLQEAIEELETRIVQLENHKNLFQYIVRETIIIVVVVVVVVWVMMTR